MSEVWIAVIAPTEVALGLSERDFSEEIEVGQPAPYDSLSDALDNPLGADEIKQALEMIEVVLKTGGSAFVFAKAVIDLLRMREAPAATLKNSKTNQTLVEIKPDSDPHWVAHKIQGII